MQGAFPPPITPRPRVRAASFETTKSQRALHPWSKCMPVAAWLQPRKHAVRPADQLRLQPAAMIADLFLPVVLHPSAPRGSCRHALLLVVDYNCSSPINALARQRRVCSPGGVAAAAAGGVGGGGGGSVCAWCSAVEAATQGPSSFSGTQPAGSSHLQRLPKPPADVRDYG
jgi:hypothetical protein